MSKEGVSGDIDSWLMKTARFGWLVIGFSMLHAVQKWSEQVCESLSVVKEGEIGRKKSKHDADHFRRPQTRPV